MLILILSLAIAGKYDPDSDAHVVWRVAQAYPDGVVLVDFGTEVWYPWAAWTGPNGARAQAESGPGWDYWNLTQHPDAGHRAWYSMQSPDVRARLRQRARMISGVVPG